MCFQKVLKMAVKLLKRQLYGLGLISIGPIHLKRYLLYMLRLFVAVIFIEFYW